MTEQQKPSENKEPEQPQFKKALEIWAMPDGKVMCKGPLENKAICIHWLCEAIKIVTLFKPSPIIKPKGGMLNFVRHKMRR